MAFFTKSGKSKVDRSSTTIIAAGTKLEGTVRVACKFHVDGEVVGSVYSDNLITIGKAGLIEGEIVAKKLVITGRLKGHAHCDEIDILAGGHVIGQLSARALVIERGSVFEGDSRLKESGEHARRQARQRRTPRSPKKRSYPVPTPRKWTSRPTPSGCLLGRRTARWHKGN